ncbi:hypothetical protein D3C77_696170 [compost metagenome]
MLGIVEGVGRGLVDRYGDRLGGRVRAVTGVDGQRFQFHVALLLLFDEKPELETECARDQ